VVGREFRFQGQTVWARQFNVEGDGLHVANDGGTLWILGYKTEGGGTLMETTGGGRTEVLGGFSGCKLIQRLEDERFELPGRSTDVGE
jgi:hypothetical protein